MTSKGFLPSLFGQSEKSPRDLFSALQGEIDRVFDSFSRGTGLHFGPASSDFAPLIDVAETADALDISVELPGLDPKDVELSVVGRQLTLRGEKKTESERKDKDWHVSERAYGSFLRSLPLPFEADPAKVEARFDKGVLKVHIAKPAEAKSEKKTIDIKAG